MAVGALLLAAAGCQERGGAEPSAGARFASRGLPTSLPPALSADQAEQVCADVADAVARARADDPGTADLAFTPYSPPAAGAARAAHVARFGGASLPVPVRPWICGAPWDASREVFSLTMLHRAKGELVLIGPMIGDAPMPDVFARVGAGAADSAAAEDFTRRLFGKAPNLFDLQEVGYSRSAADFTCDPGDLHVAIRDAVALVLKVSGKAFASGARAHRGVGLSRSHLVAGEEPSGRWSVEYSFEEGGRYGSLGVSTPDRALAEAAIALLEHAATGPPAGFEIVPLPPQCAAVAELVAAPTPERARALRDAAGDDPAQAGLVSELDRYLGQVTR